MYDIEEASVPTPPLPGEVVVAADADEAIERLATDLVQHAENCVREFGDFHIALSGGEWPGRLYRRLMLAPEYRWIPWRRTHLWFVSEQPVPLDHDDSTFRVVNDFIGDHADIPPEQVHPIFAGAETAPEDYEQKLREQLAWREKGQDRLDFVLLTVGADGSTAGLPAGVERPGGDGRLVARMRQADAASEIDGPVSMLPGLINAARFVAVLAVGPEPADGLVQAVVEPEPEVEAPPAEVTDAPASGAAGDSAPERASGAASVAPIRDIQPHEGELTWYVDTDACARILPDS